MPMKVELVACDVCRKEVNEEVARADWYAVKLDGVSPGFLGFTCAKYTSLADGMDVCGPHCVISLVQRWLQTGRLDGVAVPVAREP